MNTTEPAGRLDSALERGVRPAVPKHGLVERLRAGCTDWDGSQMAAETPPMDCLTAGDAREAADELVRLHGGKAELRPIAGTLPRMADPEADIANERRLLADPKTSAWLHALWDAFKARLLEKIRKSLLS